MVPIWVFAFVVLFGAGAAVFYFWDGVKNWTSAVSGSAAGLLGAVNKYIQVALKPLYDLISGAQLSDGAWVYLFGMLALFAVTTYNTFKAHTPIR